MNNIFNSNKLMDRFFRCVDGVVWDLMSGRIGIKNNEGIVTIEGEGDEAQVVVNMFDQFGMEVPAFAQNTPVASVAVGDLIYGTKGPLGWIVKKNDKSFELLKADGTRSNWTPPKVQMLGFDGGVMVLRSLINILPGGTSGLSNMQSMLMPLLMLGGDNVDLGQMLPIMLMSQVGVKAADGTDVAAGGGNNMGNMMQMMLMAQLLGGNKKGGGLKLGGTAGNYFDGNR